MINAARKLALVACTLGLTACGYMDNLLAPAHPETQDWVKFAPPGWYRTLYVQAEACSGLHRDYSALRFYYHVQKSPTDYLLDSQGKPVLAMTNYWTRQIWIGSESLADPMVVEHEMMHYLLDGVGGHPVEYFEQNCHLRPWSYTQTDFVRDHNMMSAFFEQNGSLDLPAAANLGVSSSNNTVADSHDEGVPPGAANASE
ncbi:MAG TPA: hypothetical protein VFA43_01360 [Gemmatimonadaceae bacterium]|nr:hypothetical protein [Gemmatimonadaceae bacterium]